MAGQLPFFPKKSKKKQPLARVTDLYKFHKPCSVLTCVSAAIYLCFRICPWLQVRLRQFPYQIWVSRLRGLPVPPLSFPKELRLCGTFKGLSHGFLFRLRRSRLPLQAAQPY